MTNAGRLVPGSNLGPYEIVSLVGAGGMGEVYRARDPRLGREVAVKVLRDAGVLDADRVRRFQAEARAAGALDHPGILAVYDVGQHGDVPYLVSELLDGETLARRVSDRGPLPARQAVDYAAQIARALAAAHAKGIVHRDIKPPNLFVIRDGRVKILDFGLAKVRRAAEDDVTLTASDDPLTRAGAVLGTVGYMAPEQVRGETADHRADIFALGVVIHEMLSGAPPFRRPTTADTLNAILRDDPPALPASVPPAIDRLVRRCLEKRPHDRYHSAHDLALALADAPPTDPLAPASGIGRRRFLEVGGTALAAGAFGWGAALALRGTPPADRSVVRRFSMDLGLVRPVISPNGRHIAYRLAGRLWVRDLVSETPREIPGGRASLGFNSDEAYYLTWSPDSRDLAVLAGDELRRVSVLEGGTATTICTLPAGNPRRRWIGGMAWSADGDTVVFSRYGAGIFEVPARGGSPVLMWEEAHADDLILFQTSRGRAVLFAATGGDGPGHGLTVRTPDGERRRIAQLESNWPELLYSPTGHILFRRNPVESPSLWALPFSPETLTTLGEPLLVQRPGFQPSLSAEGTLAYLDPGPAGDQHLAWRDRRGSVVGESSDGHAVIDALSLSPDGSQAVVVTQDAGQRGLWIYDLERFGRRRLALGDDGEGRLPLLAIWSADGTEIYVTDAAISASTVLRVPAVGTGEPTPLFTPDRLPLPKGGTLAMSSSRDGRYLVGLHGPGLPTLTTWMWTRDAAGSYGNAVQLTQEGGQFAQLSPDGRHLAFTSRGSGRIEIWVLSVPDGSRRRQVSFRGGTSPHWGPDGTELFFNERGTLMRVPVGTGPEFSAGSSAPLFDHPRLTGVGAPFPRFAVSPDGARFLTVEAEHELARPMVRVVQNWSAGFRP
jgi:hypothetical protein